MSTATIEEISMRNTALLLEINRKLDLILGYPDKTEPEDEKAKKHREHVAILYKSQLKRFRNSLKK